MRGWQYPITQADIVFRDWVDMNTSKTSPPYPRPWHPQPKKLGSASLTVAQFQALKAGAAQN